MEADYLLWCPHRDRPEEEEERDRYPNIWVMIGLKTTVKLLFIQSKVDAGMLSEEYNVQLSFLSTTEPNMFMNVFHVKKM